MFNFNQSNKCCMCNWATNVTEQTQFCQQNKVPSSESIISLCLPCIQNHFECLNYFLETYWKTWATGRMARSTHKSRQTIPHYCYSHLKGAILLKETSTTETLRRPQRRSSFKDLHIPQLTRQWYQLNTSLKELLITQHWSTQILPTMLAFLKDVHWV